MRNNKMDIIYIYIYLYSYFDPDSDGFVCEHNASSLSAPSIVSTSCGMVTRRKGFFKGGHGSARRFIRRFNTCTLKLQFLCCCCFVLLSTSPLRLIRTPISESTKDI